jgi:hypothetical protein
MHSTKDIIEEAVSLPVEERIIVVDSLLRTLNVPNPDMDKAWTEVANRRLSELRSGDINPVSGARVFEQIREKFKR